MYNVSLEVLSLTHPRQGNMSMRILRPRACLCPDVRPPACGRQVGYTNTAPQGGDYSKLPMLDLILAVEDPRAWHQENMARNWEHYSGLGHLGPRAVAYIQGQCPLTQGDALWPRVMTLSSTRVHSRMSPSPPVS
jgi:hypothetical protein